MDTDNQQLPDTAGGQNTKKSFEPLVRIIGVIILALVCFIIGYFLGKSTENKNQNTQVNSQTSTKAKKTVTKTSNADSNQNLQKKLDEALDAKLSDWKTYTAATFTIQYPPAWFIDSGSEGQGQKQFEISDVKNSLTALADSSNHIFIDIYPISGNMPALYGWTEDNWSNGKTSNPTIKAYSINGYLGNWGEMESSSGLTQNVNLANPYGGYANFEMSYPATSTNNLELDIIFNEILSTFHFVAK